MAIMGGLALSVWKYPRTTRDVDVLISVANRDPNELVTVLASAGFRAKHSPAIRRLGEMQILQMEIEPPEAYVSISVDLLLVDSEYHRQALERRVPLAMPTVSASLSSLACEDLIIQKLIAGRMIDKSDAAALLRANRDVLDCDYLNRWVMTLGLTQDLNTVWFEAFGDQAPPA